jgi:hypothetical protein
MCTLHKHPSFDYESSGQQHFSCKLWQQLTVNAVFQNRLCDVKFYIFTAFMILRNIFCWLWPYLELKTQLQNSSDSLKHLLHRNKLSSLLFPLKTNESPAQSTKLFLPNQLDFFSGLELFSSNWSTVSYRDSQTKNVLSVLFAMP